MVSFCFLYYAGVDLIMAGADLNGDILGYYIIGDGVSADGGTRRGADMDVLKGGYSVAADACLRMSRGATLTRAFGCYFTLDDPYCYGVVRAYYIGDWVNERCPKDKEGATNGTV